ncbi:uncharacterized protein LOC114123635 [Aphis gossypii]|uniref:uncharacterized protein LOC114123635 n=1 Tax=Aphis gossypii TaxID=80765 RepID=UPI0021591D90|nr:uncharacterized protein LOC114123635 [Aphis gossypii]XP_050054436.1 uncharacterized protein LOC114123635 [Aphis gossypii]XP_050054437.1 uncharacterized protein LOC114123635 [Aphis gossypii]
MWIKMKQYSIQNEEDINEILVNNMDDFNNVFELNKKNILQSNKKIMPGMDLILLKANLTPLQIQKTNSSKSLLRKNSKMYIVSCINIKNKKGEYFSSLIDDISENDRIIVINGVVLKQFSTCNSSILTVLVRPQDNSSVILFKYKTVLEKSNSLLEKNLSLLTGSGVYSLFGNVKKIERYDDEKLMYLRLQCCDKSCIKTLKYSNFVSEYKNNVNNKTSSGIKYDFYSNKINILVKSPSNDFISLSLNQRISLNNVKVKNIDDSDIFLLLMNGNSQNIKADPIEIGIINSLRPPTKHFPIPNELKPATRPKIKPLSSDVQLVLKDNTQKLSTIISSSETLPISFQQSEHNETTLLDSSNEDVVNVSPLNQEFSTSIMSIEKDNYVYNEASSFGQKKCNDNSLIQLSNKDISLYERKIFSQREISPSSSTDGSCSPSFFNTEPELLISSQETQSNNFKSNILNQPSQCIGPCRLIHTEPNIFVSNEIVSGYCTKCIAFVQKCFLKWSNQSSNMEYKCPKCSNIVHLTFFFIMNFLYGKNESQAIQVCCYNKHAEHVIKKISKKNIKLEEYLSNHSTRKLVINSIKSLISNKTKVNIIFCLSPSDNTNILMGIDTKYVVTSTTE